MQRPYWWSANIKPVWWSILLSWPYRLGAMLHRNIVRTKNVGVPVISVGNIVAGGAGKTPTVIKLAELLKAQGFTPHILSRGYGVRLAAPLRVDTKLHSAANVGDEALLLARAAPTWVFPSRVKSAQLAIAAGANILLCDDALQHHALHKDINLLVIDGDYGLGNGHLLPAGPLRENLRSALKRVSGVILIGDDKHAIAAKIPEAMPLFNANIAPVGDLSFLHLHPLIAFAGIARPEKFFASLAQLHAPVVAQHIFADHHPYSAEELQALQHEASERGAWLITTEKDWVRLPQTVRAYCHSLPVALHLQQPELMQQFLQNQLVGKVDKAHV